MVILEVRVPRIRLPDGKVATVAIAGLVYLRLHGSGVLERRMQAWLAALIGLLLVLPVLRRAALEDRVLREELEGYAAYARQVRYRMFPGVW